MIDMTPSDVTCVMCTLNFVSRHAKSHDILTPIITFDQPLWLKAFSIVFFFFFFFCFTHTIYNAALTLPTLHTSIKILTYIMLHYSA